MLLSRNLIRFPFAGWKGPEVGTNPRNGISVFLHQTVEIYHPKDRDQKVKTGSKGVNVWSAV